MIDVIFGILKESWHIFRESSPYLVFGFLVAGLLRYWISNDKIAKYLGGGGTKSVIYASVFGVPLPLCSCGVIPTAVGLHKQGASKGATLAFLVSTPETGVDSIAISYALLDPILTVFRPLAAFVTAIITGMAQNYFEPVKENNATSATKQESGLSVSKSPEYSFMMKVKKGIRYAFVSLLGDLSQWLVIGFLIAGLISYLFPTEMLHQYLGNRYLSMLVMLLLGLPLYVCATASTPIAAALILKGLDPGAALVFLLAGPATNAATMTMVAKYFGKRSFMIYLGSIIICAVMFGMLLNGIYYGLGLNPMATIGQAREFVPETVTNLCTILLLACLPYAWYQEHKESYFFRK